MAFSDLAGHRVHRSALRVSGPAPGGHPLVTRFLLPDNSPRDESPGSQGADQGPVALAPAAAGTRPARVVLPRRVGRPMRRSGPACRHVKMLLGVYVLGGLRVLQETHDRANLT